MKKRFFAILMVAAMVFSMIPSASFSVFAEDAKHPCNDEDCTVCTVANLINALPAADDITITNAAAVVEQIHAIDRIKGALSDDEYDELLTIVETSDPPGGYGLSLPKLYIEALTRIMELNVGGSLYIAKKYSVGDTELDLSQSDATFSIECIDKDTAFAPLNVTLADVPNSMLEGDFYYGYNYDDFSDGWTNKYILPAGTYKITETGSHTITTDGVSLATAPTYSGTNADDTECQIDTDGVIVEVGEGDTSSVSVMNTMGNSDVTVNFKLKKSNAVLSQKEWGTVSLIMEPSNPQSASFTFNKNSEQMQSMGILKNDYYQLSITGSIDGYVMPDNLSSESSNKILFNPKEINCLFLQTNGGEISPINSTADYGFDVAYTPSPKEGDNSKTNLTISLTCSDTNHAFDSNWSYNEENHWRECSKCGYKTGNASHTPGTAATCIEPQKCTVCKAVLSPVTAHNYDKSTWKSDDNTHWHACSCGAKSDNAKHAFTLKNPNEDALKSAATCTKAAVYYKSCECGAISKTETFTHGELADHKGGNATCAERARCTVCREFYGSPLGHDYPESWTKHDNISHVKKCKNDERHVLFEEHDSTFICGENPVPCKCGAIAEKEHKFDRKTWIHNDSHHWHGCLNCMAKVDNEEHNYPNKAMIGKVPQTCTVCDEGGHIIDTVHSALDESHITEDLKNAGCPDVASIKKKMQLAAKNATSWDGTLEDTKLYEVQLMYSKDGGISWFPASPEHFPMIDEDTPGKLPVKLPIPAGHIDTHDYTVFHMFSKNAFEKKAGDIETIETENIREFEENGQQYISFYVTGLSPIMVAWEESTELYNDGEEATDETPNETPDEAKDEKKYPIDQDGDGDIDFYLTEDEFNADDYVAVDEDKDGNTDYYVPKDILDEDDNVGSGDGSNMLPWLILAITSSLTGAAALLYRRRKV